MEESQRVPSELCFKSKVNIFAREGACSEPSKRSMEWRKFRFLSFMDLGKLAHQSASHGLWLCSMTSESSWTIHINLIIQFNCAME